MYLSEEYTIAKIYIKVSIKMLDYANFSFYIIPEIFRHAGRYTSLFCNLKPDLLLQRTIIPSFNHLQCLHMIQKAVNQQSILHSLIPVIVLTNT